jgi:hypothetical protein
VLAYSLFRDTFTRNTGVSCEIRLKGGVREHFTVEEPLDDETMLMLMSGEGFGKRSVCDHIVSNMRVLPMSSFRHAHYMRKQRQKLERGGGGGLEGGDYLETRALGKGAETEDYLGSLGKGETLQVSEHSEGWCEAKELTHYLVYEANSPQQVDASGGVLRFFGRRKSASELLDIVADKLCHVDAYVGSSSSRGHFDRRPIHNLLQVRVVVESAEQATALLQRLQSIKFSQKSLLQADVPVIRWGEAAPGHATDRLHVVDFQNRLEGQPIIGEPGSQTLMRAEEAKVGWRGLVVMVKWWGAPIMIVMEPLEVAYNIYIQIRPYTPIMLSSWNLWRLYILCVHILICMYLYICIYEYNICVCTCMYEYTHTHTHTHTHTGVPHAAGIINERQLLAVQGAPGKFLLF